MHKAGCDPPRSTYICCYCHFKSLIPKPESPYVHALTVGYCSTERSIEICTYSVCGYVNHPRPRAGTGNVCSMHTLARKSVSTVLFTYIQYVHTYVHHHNLPIQHSVTYHALSHDVTSNVCTSSISTPETVPDYTTNHAASLCSYATITVNLQFNICNITAPALYYMRTELCMKYKAQKYKMEHTNSTNNQCKA